MACCLLYRGDVVPKDVNVAIASIKTKTPLLKLKSDLIPNLKIKSIFFLKKKIKKNFKINLKLKLNLKKISNNDIKIFKC